LLEKCTTMVWETDKLEDESMRRLRSRKRGASVAMRLGAVALAAALSAQPLAAQTKMWAAVAVSPSTQISGNSHAALSQAEAERYALQFCQEGGHNDCKIVGSISGGCVALAISSKPVYDAAGTGLTRDGAATQALAACVKEGAGGHYCWLEDATCSSDNSSWLSPLPLPSVAAPGVPPRTVDPALVGMWKLNVTSGIWVWQITANGFYTFHSEAPDKAPTHNGVFTASNGKYSLDAFNMQWVDEGTYTMQGSTAVTMIGKLGKGTWIKIASDPGFPEPATQPGTRQ
jgi:hypothetical protein